MKPDEVLTTPFGHWNMHDLAMVAAEGCYSPDGKEQDAHKFAMQLVIENLVLGEDILSYTICELADAIEKQLLESAQE